MRTPTIKIQNGTETTGTYLTEFWQAIHTYGKMISVRVIVGNTVYSNDDIVSFRRFTDGGLFKTVMYGVEIEFLGIMDFTGVQFDNIQFGVSDDGGETFYYVNFGSYRCTECERNMEQKTTKAVCYDDMILAMKPYKLSITYPKTNSGLFNEICTATGLQRGGSIPTVNDSPIMASQREVETYNDKYTYRDVLDDYAELLGGCILARYGTDVYLQLRKPTVAQIDGSDLIIDEENLKTVTTYDSYPEIRTLTLSRQPQNDNTTEAMADAEGYSEIRFDDNQIVEGKENHDRTSYLAPALENANAIGEFVPYELDSYGFVLLEPCDVFYLRLSADGNVLKRCIWTGHDLQVSQGITESAKTERPDDAEVNYAMSTADQRLETQTYLYVDKVNSQIESLVGDMQNYTTIQQTEDKIALAINSLDIPTDAEIQTKAEAVLTASGLETRVTQVEGDVTNIGKYVRLGANGVEVGVLPEQEQQSTVIGVFDNASLSFYDGSIDDGTRLAWLSVSDGLGASELSVGDPSNTSRRWRLIVSDDMSHFRITRHI